MIVDVVGELESRKELAELRKAHPNVYLAHVFSMHAPKEEMEFQLGYCIADENQLIVFKLHPFEQLPPDRAFNEEKAILPLELEGVNIQPKEAQEVAMSFFAKKFPAEMVTKVIMILQKLDVTLYNFTLVTTTFNICNVRVDADSGEVLSHQFRSIMSLRESDN